MNGPGMGGNGMHRPPMPPGAMPPGAMPPGAMPHGGYPPQGYHGPPPGQAPAPGPGPGPENGGAPPGSANANSRTVFVGNIPYDADDSQLISLLKLVGPFNTFRLKHDKETEKPKGYGFCEYKDMDIAASALRNLNQYELNGRQLRVDFASDNKNGTNLKEEEGKGYTFESNFMF